MLRTGQLVWIVFHYGLTSIQQLEDSLSSHIFCCFKHRRHYITFHQIKQFLKRINVRETAVLTRGNLLCFSFVPLIPWLVRGVGSSLTYTNIPPTDYVTRITWVQKTQEKIDGLRLGQGCNINSQFLCGEEFKLYFWLCCPMIIILVCPWDFML